MTEPQENDPPWKRSEEILYEYEGICDNKLLVKFTEHLLNSFEQVLTPQELKIVMFCSNELLQNMGFYSAEREELDDKVAVGKGSYRLAINDSEILLTSVNMILPQQLDKLTEKINYYNSLNAEELKALYKQKLRTESPEDSKGGGIGILEIIRKTKNPVRFTINYQENKIYVTLQAIIRRTTDNG
ncbi:MAG: hypothetical protein HUU54_01080 [Ignavibacteriaceae bacterium]|nr:hypothetical protein [Ignavibacteriaceae bacterium]